jgi:alkylation response protein AidB-like acyl-CoA dehydrogenase
MTVGDTSQSLAGSSRALGIAREVGPALSSLSARHDRLGCLSQEALAALGQGNFFGLMVPKELGGLGASPVETLEVFEEVSRADASTGWVLTTCGFAAGLAGAFLGDAAATRVFGPGMPIIAGAGMPQGRATPVDGGFRLSGRWSYGSGIKHATHLHCGGLIYDGDKPRLAANGKPDVYIFTPSIADAKLDDQWDVLGLLGTGSVDYEITDAFLPLGYEFPIAQVKPFRGGQYYTLGAGGLSSLAHTGFALGLGRRALDELALVVQGGKGRAGALASSEGFLVGFAGAEAQYRAARAFVYSVWIDIERKLLQASPIETRDLTLTHLSLNHMMWTSARVADFAYSAAGGVSLRDGALQRCFRDIHSATQHARVAPAYLRESGRELLDLVPRPIWQRGQVVSNPGQAWRDIR